MGIVTPQKIIPKKFGARAVSVITLQQRNSNIDLKIKKKMKRTTLFIAAIISVANIFAERIRIEKKNQS